MWVVKLGGSLLGTPQLQDWLDMLVRQSDGRMVLVPGGGPFADAARHAQEVAGFDDAAAHHLALLAMDQYAMVLKALQPALVTAASEQEIDERSWQHRTILWLPSQMVLADETLPRHWSLTSDSLAAWLAARVGAERLVLVKPIPPPALADSLGRLSALGYVDACFPEFASRLLCPIHFMDRSACGGFANAMAGGPLPELAR
jgi:aspartokinase-like uncharacterized kinase